MRIGPYTAVVASLLIGAIGGLLGGFSLSRPSMDVKVAEIQDLRSDLAAPNGLLEGDLIKARITQRLAVELIASASVWDRFSDGGREKIQRVAKWARAESVFSENSHDILIVRARIAVTCIADGSLKAGRDVKECADRGYKPAS